MPLEVNKEVLFRSNRLNYIKICKINNGYRITVAQYGNGPQLDPDQIVASIDIPGEDLLALLKEVNA